MRAVLGDFWGFAHEGQKGNSEQISQSLCTSSKLSFLTQECLGQPVFTGFWGQVTHNHQRTTSL